MDLTFGAELEFADVQYGHKLPEGCKWNTQEETLVNSNGVANDPKGRIYKFGGEINTRPTSSIEEQVDLFSEIVNSVMPKPTVNHRCALQIHIGIRGLRDDLPRLRNMLIYITANMEKIIEKVSPIPHSFGDGSFNRWVIGSRHTMPSPKEILKMFAASTPEEFYLAHFNYSKAGKPQKHLHKRWCVNLRSLWENDETVEFRFFPGTTDPEEFRYALTFCRDLLQLAYGKVEDLPKALGPLPELPEYKPGLESGWRMTSYKIPEAKRKENIAWMSTLSS